MDECRNLTDQKGQKRLVRILSLFLLSQLKAKTTCFNIEMLMLIQNFCIDFVKVPEVSEL